MQLYYVLNMFLVNVIVIGLLYIIYRLTAQFYNFLIKRMEDGYCLIINDAEIPKSVWQAAVRIDIIHILFTWCSFLLFLLLCTVDHLFSRAPRTMVCWNKRIICTNGYFKI